MTVRTRKGSGTIEVVIKHRLVPSARSFTFKDHDQAVEWKKRVHLLLDDGIVPAELKDRARTSTKLRDHVDRYLETQHVSESDRACIRIVRDRLPIELELREITGAWAAEWITSLKRERNLSPGTIRHHVGALSRCLSWLYRLGDVVANPLADLATGYATYTPADAKALGANGSLKTDVERDRRLAAGEEDAIRRVMAGEKPNGRQRPLELHEAPALRVLFELALESAMRMREMYTLELSQVDLKQRTIFLDKTKNGNKRQVPLSTVAVSVLRPYLAKLDGPLVFPWWNGKSDTRTLAKTTSLLSRQFGRIFEAAGVDDFHFHDLRHEATSRIFERTKLSDVEVAKITGHSSLRMLMRYANLRASDLAARLW